MSISTGAISELAISQIVTSQTLSADPVAYAFNPQAANFLVGVVEPGLPVAYAFNPEDAALLLPQILSADPVLFNLLPQDAQFGVIEPRNVFIFDIPDFDIPSAWTIPLDGVLLIFAGYTPAFNSLMVRYATGDFAVWLGVSQGVMLGLQRQQTAAARLTFLKNLGPPFLASFIP